MEELSQNGKSIAKPARDEDSIVQSPRMKPKRWLTHKEEKGKKKMFKKKMKLKRAHRIGVNPMGRQVIEVLIS